MKVTNLICVFISIFLHLVAMPATAAWHEASSDRFLIYSKQSESDIRKFAERLERYHSALQWLFGTRDIKPSQSNRLIIYATKNGAEFRKLFGLDGGEYVAGFYIPRAGGPFTVIRPLRTSYKGVSDSERVMFHEYAHHFMYGTTASFYPRWLSEGFADFFASAEFDKKGNLNLGLPAAHLVYELKGWEGIPIELLLDRQAFRESKKNFYNDFYGRSWLLFHYLKFSVERKGQIDQYLTLFRSGIKDIDAAREAFGDLEQLDDELEVYRKRKSFSYLPIKADILKVGDITVRKLPKAEIAAVGSLLNLTSIEWRLEQEQKRLLADESDQVDQQREIKSLNKLIYKQMKKAQVLVKKHPQESKAFELLAKSHRLMGNLDDALTAVNKAVALAPEDINGNIQRAYVLSEKADSDEAWHAARRQIVKANSLEPDNPIPLMQIYHSFKRQGVKPSKNAVAAVMRALEIAPYDSGLRMDVAKEQIAQGQQRSAINTLKPLAYSPHQSSASKAAQELIEEVTNTLE